MIFFDSGGVTVFRLSASDPKSSPCRNYDIPAVPYPGEATVLEHSHPFYPGDTLPPACQKPNLKSNQTTIYGHTFGGASAADWLYSWRNNMPLIIPDLDSLYRIYPHPMDSMKIAPDTNWTFRPSVGWQTKYNSASRQTGTCSRL